MSDINIPPAAAKTAADYLKSIDETVDKLSGGDSAKKKEIFKDIANVLGGTNFRVTRGETTGGTEIGDKLTSGATGVPSLDNPDDAKAKEANLEKLIAFLQLDNEQRQTEMAKDRIELQQETLETGHDDRMKLIDKSVKEMKEAERSQLVCRIFGWIGAVLAVAAAVALTVVTGGVAAGFAIAGAAIAVTSMIMNETGATQSLTNALAESFKEDGMSASEAKMKASLLINLSIMGLSLCCSIGGMAAGFSAAASAAATAASTTGKAVEVASNTAKNVQTGISVASTGTSAGGIAAGGVSTYLTKESEEVRDDVTENQKYIKMLQQRLDESSEELQILLQEIQSALSETAGIVDSATDTSSEIANNIGHMA